MVCSATSAATETTLSAFKTSGAAGEVIAVEEDGTAIASGSTKFKIARLNSDGELDYSETIPVSGITSIKATAYSAATQKVDYIGYNGSTGSIDEIASNLYQINIDLFNYGSLSPENKYFRSAHYESTAVASTYSQEAVAGGLVKSLIWNFKREPQERIRPEMITSDAGDALGTGTATSATVLFTKGSKTVSGWADVDDATTNAALAVGNYLRVGTAVTSPIYLIEAIDTTANTLTLAWEYQGETALFNDTGLEQVTAADVAAGNCGIKLTGIAQSFTVGKTDYQLVNWDLALVDCGTTTVTNSVAASKGIGEGREVASLEWFAEGNFTDPYHGMDFPVDFAPILDASATGKYDTVVINYYHEEDAFVGTKSPRTVQVFGNADTSGTDHTNINVLITDLNTITGISLSTL